MRRGVAARPRSRGHLGHAEIAISARGVGAGATSALRGISLDILRGQTTVVCGAPGSGKTALLRVLAGLERPGEGTVWLGERRIDAAGGRPAWRYRRDQLAFIGAGDVEAIAGVRARRLEDALASDPDLVFLDEPSAGLAPAGLERVHSALHALTAIHGRTAVIATSDPEVATWGGRLLALDGGALILDLDAPTPAEARATVVSLSR